MENHLGLDYSTALKGTLTPYLQFLIGQSTYFALQKGKRTDLELVLELIFSRCVELKIMEHCNTLYLNGSDKDNLITRYCNNIADLKQVNTGKCFEVISCYYGQFVRTEKITIRDKKLMNLCIQAQSREVYVLAVDVMYMKFGLLEINEDVTFVKPFISPDGDDSFLFFLNDITWYDFTRKECWSGSLC